MNDDNNGQRCEPPVCMLLLRALSTPFVSNFDYLINSLLSESMRYLKTIFLYADKCVFQVRDSEDYLHGE